MNYVLEQLEELMVIIERYDMTFMALAVVIVALLVATIYLFFLISHLRREVRDKASQITEDLNKLAGRLLEQEQSLNRVRRAEVNNFRLICKVGTETGVLPDKAVRAALDGLDD